MYRFVTGTLYQVARMLAELVHEPLADGLARRLAPAGSGGASVPSWHTRFTKLALELVAVTSGAGVQSQQVIPSFLLPASNLVRSCVSAAVS